MLLVPGVGIVFTAALKCQGINWLMNMASGYCPDLASSDPGLLVHEMTHVWQGKNGATDENFMIESVLVQTTAGASAYDYTIGMRWGQYNPEQQASLVPRWYVDGQREDERLDSRWPYIRDFVRKGRYSD